MKAITLWRPWAYWIRPGLKTIETRGHDRLKSLVGQRIAIHAGAHFAPEALREARRYRFDDALGTFHSDYPGLPKHVVATAQAVAGRWLRESDSPAALCACDGNRYGLFLEDIIVLPEPIPCDGHQGIWTWTPPEGSDWRTGKVETA